MPRYSNRSKERLATCHPALQKVFNKVIEKYDCSILEGHRTGARQTELFKEGRTKVKAGKSKHNHKPSLAVDVVPYPLDWHDEIRFYHFIGYVLGVADSMDIKLRCGADWDGDKSFLDQTFHDLPHFELLD